MAGISKDDAIEYVVGVKRETKCKVKVLVAQLCPTFCDPIDYSPPGSSVHGILQARILEWVVIPHTKHEIGAQMGREKSYA